MTTIAVNHSSIACDLQMTYGGGIKMKTASKILELNPDVAKHLFNSDKAFVGFSGNASTWGAAVAWFIDPSVKPPNLRGGVEMIALTSNKDILHSTTLTTWLPIKEKHTSIGSGMPFALSALELGKTPKEAVLFASKRDIYSGMGVKEYTL
jgi:ATP-dependent protease HslVU (ClpYQ) peptidase subunit